MAKGEADFFAPGDWNATCHRCGRKRKASQLRKHWQGYWVCPEHWEPRHPQDFVRAQLDNPTVPFVQNAGDIDIQICTFNGQSAIPGWAVPGCMIPGNSTVDPGFIIFDELPPCTLFGKSAIPGWATPGCAVPGNLNIYDENT